MTNILHYYLDTIRGEGGNKTGFHNILNTMKISRRGKVCGENFDNIDLQNEPLTGIYFSDNGENASTFRGCRVGRRCFLCGHSAPIEKIEFLDDKLVSESAEEIPVWDSNDKLIGVDHLCTLIEWDIRAGKSTKIDTYIKKSDKKDFEYLNDEKEQEIISLFRDFPEINALLSNGNEKLYVREIKNSDYLRLIGHSENFFVVNIENKKIILHTKGYIRTPIYIPSIDSLLISYYKLNKTCLIYVNEKRSVSLTDFPIKIFDDNCTCLPAVSKNGEYIAVPNHDYGLELFSSQTGRQIKKFGGYTSMYFADISNDKKYAMLCPISDSAHNILLWDLSNNHILRSFTHISGENDFCKFSPYSNIAAICYPSKYMITVTSTKEPYTGISIYYPKGHSNHIHIRTIWDDSEKYIFLIMLNGYLLCYDTKGNFVFELVLHKEKIGILNFSGGWITSAKISENLEYVAVLENPLENATITVINTKTKQMRIIKHKCRYILKISEDGRYVTVINDIDAENLIIKIELLDIYENTCIKNHPERNPILVNDCLSVKRTYTVKEFFKSRSSGWTITLPCTPDGSKQALIYLVPNLYIAGCDFSGCELDNVTREVIRQYNGLV